MKLFTTAKSVLLSKLAVASHFRGGTYFYTPGDSTIDIGKHQLGTYSCTFMYIQVLHIHGVDIKVDMEHPVVHRMI